MSKYVNKYKLNIAKVKFQVTKLRNSIFKFPGPINQQIKFTKSHQNFPNWQKSDLKQNTDNAKCFNNIYWKSILVGFVFSLNVLIMMWSSIFAATSGLQDSLYLYTYLVLVETDTHTFPYVELLRDQAIEPVNSSSRNSFSSFSYHSPSSLLYWI